MSNFLKSMILISCIGMMVACSGQHQPTNSKEKVVNNPTFGRLQNSSKPPITFTQELTIGNQNNIILSAAHYLKGPVVDESGNIYFIDVQKGKMYSFTPDGKLRWEKGHLGKGPGDFTHPLGIAINGDYLYVANIRGSRIDKFNLDGKFINSILLAKYNLRFTFVNGVISDSLLVLSSFIRGEIGDKVTLLNTADSLKKVAQFNIVVKKSPIPSAISLPLHVTNSLIAVANPKKYVFEFYNIKDEKIKTVTRNFNKMVYAGISYKSGLRVCPYGELLPPVDLHNGYYVATINWTTNVSNPNRACKQQKKAAFKSSVDLFRKDGTLLYSLTNDGKFPSIGMIAYVDSKGNVYTKTNKPFPQIRRYSVKIHPISRK